MQNSHYSARYKLYLTNCWSDKLLIITIAIHMSKNYMHGLPSNFEQFFLVKNNLLTSVHNDADDTDDYNRVIGIAKLKAFSCAKKGKILENLQTTLGLNSYTCRMLWVGH